MKTRIPRIDTNGSKPDSGLMQFVIIRAISVFGCAALLISLLIPVAQMHAQTQAAMNAQVRAEFEQADAELNKTYEALLAKLPDAESKQKLKESQRAWLAFRDAEAGFAADQARGGSMAPTIRYETITELTRQRIKQLKTRLGENGTPREGGTVTPPPSPEPQKSAETNTATETTAEPNSTSLSPDKKWQHIGGEEPKILKADTKQVALDLWEQGPGGVLWAPDSKRFALKRSRGHQSSLYQWRGDHWVALESPEDKAFSRADAVVTAQLKRKGLSKKTSLRSLWWTVEADQWVDASTLVVHASLAERVNRGETDAEDLDFGGDFLFTLKFDDAGNWKIIKTHRMSDKEVEKRGE
jgi:uncharacterized protein YecT (DUF1311 family)